MQGANQVESILMAWGQFTDVLNANLEELLLLEEEEAFRYCIGKVFHPMAQEIVYLMKENNSLSLAVSLNQVGVKMDLARKLATRLISPWQWKRAKVLSMIISGQ